MDLAQVTKPTSLNSKNADFRRANVEKTHLTGQNSTENYSLMYGLAVFWDIVLFVIGLFPGVGWLVNFILFGCALLNMYIMAISRGKTTQEFWKAFKHIYVEPIPYLNILPTFTRGVYLLSH